MTPTQFRAWRTRCGLSSWQAVAELLDLSPRTVERYASGASDIPKTVALACEALEARAISEMPLNGRPSPRP